jgi:hypothetical protein
MGNSRKKNDLELIPPRFQVMRFTLKTNFLKSINDQVKLKLNLLDTSLNFGSGTFLCGQFFGNLCRQKVRDSNFLMEQN